MIKTVSLETAKALKEAGFRQDTRLYFGNTFHHDRTVSHTNLFERNIRVIMMYPFRLVDDEYKFKYEDFNELYAAPTTDELLEELPTAHGTLGNLMFKKVIRSKTVKYECVYGNQDISPFFQNESFTEAIAQMWLWLKKENLSPSTTGR